MLGTHARPMNEGPPQNSKLIHYKLDLLSNIQTRGIPKNRVVYDQIIFPSSGVKFQWLFFGVSCW